jgi:hypothetical protein
MRRYAVALAVVLAATGAWAGRVPPGFGGGSITEGQVPALPNRTISGFTPNVLPQADPNGQLNDGPTITNTVGSPGSSAVIPTEQAIRSLIGDYFPKSEITAAECTTGEYQYGTNADGTPKCRADTGGEGLTQVLTNFSTAQSPAQGELDGAHTYRMTGGTNVAFNLPTAAASLFADLANITASNLVVTPETFSDVLTVDGTALAAGNKATCPKGFFKLIGTGTNAWDLWTVSGTACADGGATFASGLESTGDVAFGNVAVSTTSDLNATWINNGSGPTGALGAASIGGGDAAKFSVQTDGCTGQVLAPAGTCNVAIRFTPGAVAGGPYAATVTVSTVAANLTGTGTDGVAPTYLVNEDWEGTGVPSGWSNSPSSNYDLSTAGMDMVGSQCLSTPAKTNGATVGPYYTISAAGELWGYFKLRITDYTLNSGTYRKMFWLSNGGTSVFSVSLYNNAGTLYLRGAAGNQAAIPADAVTTGTTYNVWVHYKKGTGADAEGSIEFATTDTKVGSGNKFASFTGGNSTADVNRVLLQPEYITAQGADVIWDKVRLDDVAIGSAPQ